MFSISPQPQCPPTDYVFYLSTSPVSPHRLCFLSLQIPQCPPHRPCFLSLHIPSVPHRLCFLSLHIPSVPHRLCFLSLHIPSVPHYCCADTILEGYTIPAGTTVLPSLDSVLMDEDTWEEPLKFRPERFLNQGKIVKPDAFIPFSMGKVSIFTAFPLHCHNSSYSFLN